MLHTIISYLSRFNRLALLAFALVVVLILVLFTVNSATETNKQETSDSTTSASTQEDGVVADQNQANVEQASTDESLVVISESSAANSTNTSSGSPQAFTANTLDLDSDELVVVAVGDGSQLAEDQEGHVSSTSTNLPSTGVSSVVATVVGLMVVSVGVASYTRSKKNLTYELLEINR